MMSDEEMQERRDEKQREAPMHPSLKQMALESAARWRQQDKVARETILCECRCPPKEPCACGCRNHPHTLHAAFAAAREEDWGRQLRAAQDNTALDIGSLLRKASCPEFAITRIQHGGLDERPSLYSAKVYQGVVPDQPGPDGKQVRFLAAQQLQRGQRRPYLGLFGDTDRGKTVAAVWAMAQSMRRYAWNGGATGSNQDFPFAFVRMVEFAGTLAWDEAARKWLERLKRARLVILDDMGKEHLSPAAQMMLFEVLDTRYGQGLSTIITSQLKVAEFQLRYDGASGADGKPGAIFRRLKERGVILRDGGDAGAILMRGDDKVKRWPKSSEQGGVVVQLHTKRDEPKEDE